MNTNDPQNTATAMTDFQIKCLPYNLTAQAGLSLVGQYLKRFPQMPLGIILTKTEQA